MLHVETIAFTEVVSGTSYRLRILESMWSKSLEERDFLVNSMIIMHALQMVQIQ